MVRICGLRWYKNRALYNYDMDAKQIQFERIRNAAVRPENPVIHRRAILTTLSRIFPMHREARSPRPVDAFTGVSEWLVLSGNSEVVGGETCKVVLAANGYKPVSAEARTVWHRSRPCGEPGTWRC